MRKLLMAALLAMLPAAAGATCTYTTGPILLSKIRSGDPASVWIGCVNDTIEKVSSTAISTSAAISTSTALGGVLSGKLPNPTIASQVVLSTHIAPGAVGDVQSSISTNGVAGVMPVAKGGTGGTSQATAQSGLGVPSTTGSGASGTWGISITGNAATASALAGGAFAGHAVGTGTLAGGTTVLTTQPDLGFDARYFTAQDDPTHHQSFFSLNTSSNALNVTRQVFLSGSGTYTTPAGVSAIRVLMVAGGGGGGGGGGATPGSVGTNTVFGSTTAYGGGGGNIGGGYAGGAGGTGGVSNASVTRIPGSQGGNGTASNMFVGITGGASCLGGGAAGGGGNGIAPAANTGAGGSSGSPGGNPAYGAGGGGECVDFYVPAPGSSYSYSVSTGGAGGPVSGTSGGNGASGRIEVYEYYPSIGPVGQQGTAGAAGANGVSFNGGFSANDYQIWTTTPTNPVTIGNSVSQASVTVHGGLRSSTAVFDNGSGDGLGSVGAGSYYPALKLSTQYPGMWWHSTLANTTDYVVVNNGGDLRFYKTIDNVGTQAFTMSRNGFFGINEATPSYPFEIKSDRAHIARTNVTATASGYDMYTNGGGTSYFGRDNSTGSEFGGPAYSDAFYGAAGRDFYIVPGGGTGSMIVAGPVRLGVGGTPLANISTGTYTPTLTNGTNVAASANPFGRWVRIGNIVVVTGYLEADPTAGADTVTQIDISIPVASNFTTANDLRGIMSPGAAAQWSGFCRANAANDRAECFYAATTASIGNTGWDFSLTYEIK